MTTLAAALLAASAFAAPEPLPLDAVREHVEQQQWKKAKKALHRGILDIIKADGQMDGQDLVRAVRYRALIEAGKGNEASARWWWHAGLNLQSDGAAPWLDLIPAEKADVLRDVKVRPSVPRGRGQGPTRRLKGDPPGVGSNELYLPALRRYQGSVTLEVRFGERHELLEPLLEEVSGVPTVCVYVALDSADGVRYSPQWRAMMPDVIGHSVVFVGRS